MVYFPDVSDLVLAPTSPRISSPLARSATVPLNHPHARKQSVFDGQLQLQDFRPPPTMSPFSPTPNASTSTFSLSLDPISEGVSSPVPPTPSFPSPVPESTPAVFHSQPPHVNGNSKLNSNSPYSYPPRSSHQPPRRPAHLGLGHGPPPGHASQAAPPRTAFSSSFPMTNTELILYSYAQLVGSLSLTPLPGTITNQEQTRALQVIRSSLLKPHTFGGGSLDIASHNGQTSAYSQRSASNPSRRLSHGRSNSLSAGLMSLLSPSSSTPLASSQSWTPSHKPRTPSMFSGILSPTASSSGMGGLGVGASGDDESVNSEAPLPTFEVQPTMLAVDLSLGPGESRSCA